MSSASDPFAEITAACKQHKSAGGHVVIVLGDCAATFQSERYDAINRRATIGALTKNDVSVIIVSSSGPTTVLREFGTHQSNYHAMFNDGAGRLSGDTGAPIFVNNDETRRNNQTLVVALSGLFDKHVSTFIDGERIVISVSGDQKLLLAETVEKAVRTLNNEAKEDRWMCVTCPSGYAIERSEKVGKRQAIVNALGAVRDERKCEAKDLLVIYADGGGGMSLIEACSYVKSLEHKPKRLWRRPAMKLGYTVAISQPGVNLGGDIVIEDGVMFFDWLQKLVSS